MLLNGFEEFTYAMFVGEKGGSSPTHFGDSKKINLENSGITLRVSKLYWPSWLSGEFRDANNPHIDAGPTSEAFYAGRDPALEAINTYHVPATFGEQISEQFRLGKIQNGVILFMRRLTDGTIKDHTMDVPDLVQSGHQLLDEGMDRPGYFIFLLTYQYFPKTADLVAGYGRSNEILGNKENAGELYQEALELDPENSVALAGLERLSSQER